MKTLLKILLLSAIGAAAAVVLVFREPDDVSGTTDAFLAAIRTNDVAGAMEHLSVEFRSDVDESALRDFLSRNGLLNFKEPNGDTPHVLGRRATQDLSVRTEYGQQAPIRLTFVQERAGWKIYSFHRLASGLMADGADPRAPRPMELHMLVQQVMTDFALAIRSGNMADFHATLSAMGQGQYSVDMLNDAYAPIMNAGVDLTVIVQVEPVFEGEPRIDDHGIMTVAGHYPSFPRHVFFQQSYVHEGIRWRLVGMNINIE